MNLIDAKQYFTESEKAVQVALKNEEKLHRQVPAAERLRMVEEELQKAKTRDEYEQLKALKKDLELKIKMNELKQPAIPAEYREKIRQNREIEEQQAAEKLNELKAELSAKIAEIENELIPLVTNIENLEKRMLIGKKIDILLQGEIFENAHLPSASFFARGLSFSSDHNNAGKAGRLLKETLTSLKKIQVPKQTKGFFKKTRKAVSK